MTDCAAETQSCSVSQQGYLALKHPHQHSTLVICLPLHRFWAPPTTQVGLIPAKQGPHQPPKPASKPAQPSFMDEILYGTQGPPQQSQQLKKLIPASLPGSAAPAGPKAVLRRKIGTGFNRNPVRAVKGGAAVAARCEPAGQHPAAQPGQNPTAPGLPQEQGAGQHPTSSGEQAGEACGGAAGSEADARPDSTAQQPLDAPARGGFLDFPSGAHPRTRALAPVEDRADSRPQPQPDGPHRALAGHAQDPCSAPGGSPTGAPQRQAGTSHRSPADGDVVEILQRRSWQPGLLAGHGCSEPGHEPWDQSRAAADEGWQPPGSWGQAGGHPGRGNSSAELPGGDARWQ